MRMPSACSSRAARRERAYIIFFPFRNTIERRLGRLPMGAQYYVASSR